MKRSLALLFTPMVFVGFTASAYAQTVSAHGSGVIPATACSIEIAGCDTGGKGMKFSFSFSGTGPGFPDPNAVPVSGTWTASEGDSGVQVEFVAGTATVFMSTHTLVVGGTCITTTRTTPPTVAACFFSATDATPNGAVDTATIHSNAANGTIIGSGELASGNNNIE
jgi:hypothetical protein